MIYTASSNRTSNQKGEKERQCKVIRFSARRVEHVVLHGRPAATARRPRGRSSTRELSRQIVPHNRSRSICSCCGRREFFACPKGCRSFFSAHERGAVWFEGCTFVTYISHSRSGTQLHCNYSIRTNLFFQLEMRGTKNFFFFFF